MNFNEVWKCLKSFNLMISMFFLGFSISLNERYRDNLIYRQVCKNRLQIDFKFCYKIPENNVTSIGMMDILNSSSTHVFAMIGLKILFGCISACLLCSWSDSYGRKFPLLIALMGENFEFSVFFISDVPFVYFMAGLYILTALSGLFGGYACIFSMTYCYLTDTCPPEDRILAFTLIDFMLIIGIVGGVLTFKKWMRNNTLLISFSSLLAIRCFLIVWILLTYTQKNFDSTNDKFLKKFRMLFSVTHVEKTYKAITKWRQNCESEQLMLLICSTIPVMMSYSMIEGVVVSSVIHAKLFDNFREYQKITLYIAVYSCIVEPVAILLYRCLGGVSDSTLGIVGFCSLYLYCFIAVFSKDHMTFSVGLGLAPLKAFAAIGLRSAYSKIATADERGKLFFLFSVAESLAIFASYFLYNKLRYILTDNEDTLPHMFMSMLLIVSLCTFTFEKMSIQTDHLFEKCFRTLHLQSVRNVPGSSSAESE